MAVHLKTSVWLKGQINSAVEQAHYESLAHPNNESLQCRYETLAKMAKGFEEYGIYVPYEEFREFTRILMDPYLSEF